MREILFRGKQVDNGKWIEGYLVQKVDVDAGLSDFYIVDRFEYSQSADFVGKLYDCLYVINPETVGQYTGLTDKNGTKIFEGDIIQTVRESFRGKITHNFVIKYGAYIPVYYCKEIYAEWETIGFYAFDGKKTFQLSNQSQNFLVIGNIHDNPELLESEG